MTKKAGRWPLPRFEAYPDRSGEWRWRWLARNGRIRADSGEGYWSKRSCLRSIERVRGELGATVDVAVVVLADPPDV